MENEYKEMPDTTEPTEPNTMPEIDIKIKTHIRTSRIDVYNFIEKQRHDRKIWLYLSKLVERDFEARTNPKNTDTALLHEKIEEMTLTMEKLIRDNDTMSDKLSEQGRLIQSIPAIVNISKSYSEEEISKSKNPTIVYVPEEKAVTTPVDKAVTTPVDKAVTTPVDKAVTTPVDKTVVKNTENEQKNKIDFKIAKLTNLPKIGDIQKEDLQKVAQAGDDKPESTDGSNKDTMNAMKGFFESK